MSIGQCKTCAAFSPAQGIAPGGGFCRRHPPLPIMGVAQGPATPGNPSGMTPSVTGQFPPVHEANGCCDYLPVKLATN